MTAKRRNGAARARGPQPGFQLSPPRVLGAAAVALGAAAAGAFAYSSRRYVNQLRLGLQQLANGDYGARIEPPPCGPLKELVTAYNSAVDALAARALQQDDFLFNVSHEFKTPLSYIQGFATLLQNEDLPENERRECLKSITTGTRRLSDMVSSLLELSIASNPQSQVEMADFSLDEQLRHALATFVPLMDQRGIGYSVDLQDVTVRGNETLLGEVWANVLSNAVKFTGEGGTVAIGLRADGGAAVVTIRDTGVGMSEERLARAYDRFYHDDASGYEGTGLGLAIAKAIVDGHDGTIQLASELGVGTTCTVTLPLGPSQSG